MDIRACIRARRSVRRFDGRPLEPADRAALEALCRPPRRGPLGSEARFRLLDFTRGGPRAGGSRPEGSPLEGLASEGLASEGGEELRVLGTYGTIRGTRAFLAGAVRGAPGDLEDYGFLLERIVLQATARGLGTCWLGGFFNRGGFARVLDLQAEESLPAVIAVGRPAAREGLVDLAFHLATASRSRRPWSALFFDGRADRPLEPEAAGPWREPLEMVRLAPSANNRQPWRVVREGAERFHFCREGTAGRLDLGIAMCHFELAAAELGLGGSWRSAADSRPAAGSQPAGGGAPGLPRPGLSRPGLPLPAGWTWTACWDAGEARP